MHAEWIPAFEYQRQRWKNALGWTREVAREEADDGFDWRVSIAEIDRDCPFSAFPGFRRSLVLLHGGGMRLEFADGETSEILPPHGRIDFDGARALHCQLIDGPTEDFNLMWNPDRIEASLHHRPLVGTMVFFPEPDCQWLIYLLAGTAAAKDARPPLRLEVGDSLRLHGDNTPQRWLLEGAGEVLIVKIKRIAPPAPPEG